MDVAYTSKVFCSAVVLNINDTTLKSEKKTYIQISITVTMVCEKKTKALLLLIFLLISN